MVKTAPPSGWDASSTRPPWPSAMARTIVRPRPGALAPGALAAGEALEDALALVLGHARPAVADGEARAAARHGRRQHDRVALAGVLHRVLGELHERLGQALAVGDDDAAAGLGRRSSRAGRAPPPWRPPPGSGPRRPPSRSRGSRAAPRVASIRTSSTRRDIRSSSSSTSASVSARSSGSSPISSRCPRTMVIGVRSSCPASSMKRRWVANADSRRSSISLNVLRELGHLVVAGRGDAPAQVRLADLVGGQRHGVDRGDDALGRPPREEGPEQQHDDPHPGERRGDGAEVAGLEARGTRRPRTRRRTGRRSRRAPPGTRRRRPACRRCRASGWSPSPRAG